MNKTKIIYTILILNLFISNVLSQNIIVQSNKTSANRAKVISSSTGSTSLPTPSDSSDTIKYKIKIEKDSAFFSLKADIIEKGVINENFYTDIVLRTKVFKGQEAIFDIVPDISKANIMTLYTYISGTTVFRYLNCDNKKHIKYKKFKAVDQLKNSLIPLILCYVDDEQNSIEKLLEKYFKDNLISILSNEELQEKILKNIERGLLVYYNLSEK